ncbi:MAG: AraC family transcriptional regulator ligand-binding domain-containing protein [Thiohalocapsa sp.]
MKEGSLRIAPLLPVPQLLSRLRFDPEPILAEAGLDMRQFDDPETSIPFATAGRLLALCVERTGCAEFGHLVGEAAGIEVLGLIGRTW